MQDYNAPGSAYWHDYFFSDYISGDAMASDGAGYTNRYSYNHGYDLSLYGLPHGVLYGSNGDESGYDYVRALSSGTYFHNWAEGQTGFGGTNYMLDDSGTYNLVYSALTLVDISNVNPVGNPAVPEPSAMALMGLGLVGLGMAARKIRK